MSLLSLFGLGEKVAGKKFLKSLQDSKHSIPPIFIKELPADCLQNAGKNGIKFHEIP